MTDNELPPTGGEDLDGETAWNELLGPRHREIRLRLGWVGATAEQRGPRASDTAAQAFQLAAMAAKTEREKLAGQGAQIAVTMEPTNEIDGVIVGLALAASRGLLIFDETIQGDPTLPFEPTEDVLKFAEYLTQAVFGLAVAVGMGVPPKPGGGLYLPGRVPA